MDLRQFAQELDVDLPTVLDRMLDKEELYIKILKLFCQEGYMEGAEKAFRINAYQEVSEQIHSVKGSAYNLGFQKLGDLCNEIIDSIKNGNPDNIQEMFQETREEYIKIVEKIGQLT